MNGAQFTILLRAVGAGQVAGEINKVQSVIGGLNRFLAGLGVTLSVGAFAKLTKDAIDYADQMGKVAQKVGIAVDELSRLTVAARVNDLSTEQLATGLKNMARYLVENGQGGKSPSEALAELADRFQRMPDGAQKTALALKIFGRSGLDMIPMLNQGSEGIRKLMNEAGDLNMVVGPNFARNADEFNDNLARIGMAFKGIFLQVANALLPELLKLSEWVVNWLKTSGALEGSIGTLVDIYKTFAAVIAEVAFAFDALGSFMGTFFGTLSVSGNPIEAWSAASDQFEKKLKSLESRMLALSRLGQPGEPGVTPAGNEDDAALQAAIDHEKFKLEIIEEQTRQMSMRGADRLGYRSRGSFGLELAGLRAQIDILGEINQGLRTQQDALEETTAEWQKLELEIEKNITKRETLEKQVTDVTKREADQRTSIRNSEMSSAASILGSAADAAKLFGREGFVAWKAFALAQAVVAGALAVVKALAEVPYPANIAAAVAAGAAAAVQIATIATTQPGFESGGYTGSGPTSQPAGIVHGREFVMSAPAVDRIGVANLEAMNSGQSAAPVAGGPNINIAFIREEHVSNWLRSTDGRQVLLNVMRQEMHRI